jgi:hypothetical protein
MNRPLKTTRLPGLPKAAPVSVRSLADETVRRLRSFLSPLRPSYQGRRTR